MVSASPTGHVMNDNMEEIASEMSTTHYYEHSGAVAMTEYY